MHPRATATSRKETGWKSPCLNNFSIFSPHTLCSSQEKASSSEKVRDKLSFFSMKKGQMTFNCWNLVKKIRQIYHKLKNPMLKTVVFSTSLKDESSNGNCIPYSQSKLVYNLLTCKIIWFSAHPMLFKHFLSYKILLKHFSRSIVWTISNVQMYF